MARQAAWATMQHRRLWLDQTHIPEASRHELLEAPIHPDGLFGPRFRAMVDSMKATSEEAKAIRRHFNWSEPPARQQRFHERCPYSPSGGR
ncbi:hypothetical protein L3Q82_006009 [Scomber scombrus]|uniref:Uncharacterized protein n=1 Tax=Scomber scombrus TaxID=13677 RepID=A0AAV1PCK7_SCOSC